MIFGGSRQPAYFDVDVGGFLNPKQVLLPIGPAQVDASEQIVWIPEMTKDQFKALPDCSGDPATITDHYESRVRKACPSSVTREDLFTFNQRPFQQRKAGASREGREARITCSEEELAVGKRPVQAGEVGVKKTVETQHVREPVTKRREEVEIERRPVEGAYARGAEIGEDEIRVPLVEEEIVAEKRPVVKEEIVVKKRTVEETENVEADLKKERIDVQQRGRTKRGRDERGEMR